MTVSPDTRQSIAIVAGEPSGDLLGSLLVGALLGRHDDLDFFGIAGPRMQALGVRSDYPMDPLSVRGYVEVLSKLPTILSIRARLRRQLSGAPPKLFIGVDAPDFNLPLERTLRGAGVPTVHFVSPSIWAWRAERIEKIRRAVSRMLLIFPFEEAIYRDQGIPATYVGHPLAFALPEKPDREAALARLGLDAGGEYLGLLPGSRDSELRFLADLYVRVAMRLVRERPGLCFLVPLVKEDHRRFFESTLTKLGTTHLPVRFFRGQAHDVMQAADVALVASGTATLEALILDCPHVITYRMPWLTKKLMMRNPYLPYVGLPNILAGRFIVPEPVLDKATPDQVAAPLLELLGNPAARATMRADFAPIRAALRRDTPREIAGALAPFLS